MDSSNRGVIARIIRLRIKKHFLAFGQSITFVANIRDITSYIWTLHVTGAANTGPRALLNVPEV